MKLTLAIAIILVELGAGMLLLMPLVPIAEVRKSFFTFHSLLAGILFVLGAGVCQFELARPQLAVALALIASLCVAAFGTSRIENAAATRVLHAIASLAALAWLVAVVSPLAAAPLGAIWAAGCVLGALLLGAAHNAMALGHWYLISRNLSFGYLIRITKVVMGAVVVRGVFLTVVCFARPADAASAAAAHLSRMLSYAPGGDGMFFLMRVAWGLVLPLVLAFMAWRCAIGKANQAATGLLYLCEFSVLFGELFAAYLMV